MVGEIPYLQRWREERKVSRPCSSNTQIGVCVCPATCSQKENKLFEVI